MAIPFKSLKSNEVAIDDIVRIGQYYGKTYREVLEINPSYLLWLQANTDTWLHPDLLDEAVYETYNKEALAKRRNASTKTESVVYIEDNPFDDVPW